MTAEENGAESLGPRTRSSKKQEASRISESTSKQSKKATRLDRNQTLQTTEILNSHEEPDYDESKEYPLEGADEMTEDEDASVAGDADGYKSPMDTPAELQNFPLSKARLSKNNIVYGDDNTLCVRIREKMVWFNRSRRRLDLCS